MKRISLSHITSVLGIVLGFVITYSLVAFAFAQIISLPSLTSTPQLPSVVKAWPETGGRSQYITLEGEHFGYEQGKVVFVRRGVEFSADIPNQTGCDGQTWHDTYVVIKVPPRLEVGQYTIKLYRSDNQSAKEIAYTVTSATPTPGICALTPDNGPAGIAVKVYGDNFGTSQGRLVVDKADLTIQPGGWSNQYIEAVTPVSLNNATGQVRIVDNSNNLSNPIPFTVGRCTTNICGGGGSCCNDGSCRSIGMCVDKPLACSYRWSFFTGDLKKVGDACTANEQCISSVCTDKKCSAGILKENASCIWDQQCSSGLMCLNGACKSKLRPVGQSCRAKEECASGVCTASRCAQGTRPTGSQCDNAAQCTSNNCVNSRCVAAKKKVQVVDITNGTGLPRNAAIKVVFNQPVDEGTARQHITISPDPRCAFSFVTVGQGDNAHTEAICNPTTPLNPNTKYNVNIDPGVQPRGTTPNNPPIPPTTGNCPDHYVLFGGMCLVDNNNDHIPDNPPIPPLNGHCSYGYAIGIDGMCYVDANHDGHPDNPPQPPSGGSCMYGYAPGSDGMCYIDSNHDGHPDDPPITETNGRCPTGYIPYAGGMCLRDSNNDHIVDNPPIPPINGHCSYGYAIGIDGMCYVDSNHDGRPDDPPIPPTGGHCIPGFVLGIDGMCYISTTTNDPNNTNDPGSTTVTTGTGFSAVNRIVIYVNGVPKSYDRFTCIKNGCEPNDMSTTEGNQHQYRVEAQDMHGYVLANLQSYTWSVDGSNKTLKLPSNLNTNMIEVTALSVNGSVNVNVDVEERNPSCDPNFAVPCNKKGTITRESVTVENILCEQPWEFDSTTPGLPDGVSLIDFNTSYCKGNSGTQLPSLLAPVSVDTSKSVFEKEYVFHMEDPANPGTINPKNSDVIVMRVGTNKEQQSPYQWYLKSKAGTNPTAILINGYQAVRDTQGVYVGVPGRSTNDDNLYILSFTYNEGASASTQQIFSSIVNNLQLSTFTSGTQSGILRKDVLRLSDMADMKYFLERYKTDGMNQSPYPSLNAGSFFKGQTLSAWPSWQSTLGNILHVALPTDPHSPFPGCTGYNPSTCWNEQTGRFAFGSKVKDALSQPSVYVYTYTTDNGKNYELCMNLEDPARFHKVNPYCSSSSN